MGMGPAWVVLIVTLATAVQPVGTDLYLSALPAIRREFAAPVSVVQLTLAPLVLSFGISQLLWGPVSDRFGRRKVLIAGFLLYAGSAMLAAFAPSIRVLIAARILQGLGIAATMVCGRAIVRDLYEQQQGTHVMTIAMSVLACITMLVPVLGALLTETLGWRSTLGAMSCFGFAGLLLVLLRIPETARALKPDALRLLPLLGGYARILRNPAFRSWTLLNAFGYAANFGFYSSSAYLFLETYQVSRLGFGMVIGGASITYLIGTVMCRRWIARHGIVTSVRRAGFLSLLAAALLLLPQLANAHSAASLTAGLWVMLLAYGIHQPCGHVGMAMPFPLQAGAASALGGFAFATSAFLCGTWLGLMFESGSSAVLAFTTGLLAAATGLTALTLVQRHGPAVLAAKPAP